MIFDREPTDWSDLQKLVAQMFRELGCEVEVGQRANLVRGRKEIDVAVRDPSTTPPSQYLCECKHWRRRVPQEFVHSFRTVLADYGAHRGFIISRVGFQAGAHEAAQKTNIDLLTFTELQAIFFDRWRVSMGERFMPYGDRLFPYWDFPGKMPRIPWTKEHVEEQHRLVEAYLPLVRLGPWLKMNGFKWNLPIVLPSLDNQRKIMGTSTLRTYRELYDFIDAKKDVALRDFQMLYGEIEP